MTREKWFYFSGTIFGILYASVSRDLDWPFWADLCVCVVFYWAFYYGAALAVWLWSHFRE